MSQIKAFFEELFYPSFDRLNVFSENAKDIVSPVLVDLLMQESVNQLILKACIEEFVAENNPRRWRILFDGADALDGIALTLANILKGAGLDVAIFCRNPQESNRFSMQTVSKIDTDDMLAKDLLSPSGICDKYRQALEKHRCQFENSLSTLANRDETLIVFAAKKVYFNQLRFSKALRDNGYKTVAVVFDSTMTKHQCGFFDEIIYTDLLSFLLYLNSTQKSLLLHTQGWLFRYHIPVIIDIYKNRFCKQITEIMDSQAFYLPQSTVRKIPDIMRLAWGDMAIENHRLQLACESYIVHHSDGVIFNGDDSYRDRLVKNDSKNLKNKHLAFPALPLKDFFHVSTVNNQNKRLVFLGGIPPASPNRPRELFGDAQIYGLVEKLVSKNCYLDIYNNPLIADERDYARLYPEFIRLATATERFNFMAGDLPQFITKKISKYDIGLMIYDFYGSYAGELHFKHLIPTKLFSYLEAGLPVLVSDRFKAVCDIVKEYRIGVIVSQREIDLIPEIIDMIDIAELKRNVLVAREELQMHNNIHKLTGFYQQVMA